jgi:hypothetical protein
MRHAIHVAPAFLVIVGLAGCPEPPPMQSPEGQQGPSNGSLPGAPAGGPAAGGPPEGAAAGTAGGAGGAFAPPGFASLVKDGKTITISGVVTNATKAQVDFTIAKKERGQYMPFVVEVVQVTDGKFSVTAPATYDEPFYVSAVVDAKGDGPTPDDKGGMLAEPLKLEGKDVNITLAISDKEDWEDKVPWTRPDDAPGAQGGAGGPPPGVHNAANVPTGGPPNGGPPPGREGDAPKGGSEKGAGEKGGKPPEGGPPPKGGKPPEGGPPPTGGEQ